MGRHKKGLVGITQMEFAKRDGCSISAVNMAIKAGALIQLADGSLDPQLVKTGWRATNRRALEKKNPKSEDTDVSTGMSLTKAEHTKAVYEALKRKREHDLATGQVVPIEEVTKQMGEAFAKVRTKLLSLPSEHAPQINMMKTAPEVKDYLEKIITRALEALSSHG